MRYVIEPIFETEEEDYKESVYEKLIRESRIEPRRGAESWLFLTIFSMIGMLGTIHSQRRVLSLKNPRKKSKIVFLIFINFISVNNETWKEKRAAAGN